MFKPFFFAIVTIIFCSNALGQTSSFSYANLQIAKAEFDGDLESSSKVVGISIPISDSFFMTHSYETGKTKDNNVDFDGIGISFGHHRPLNDSTDFVSSIQFGTATADLAIQDVSADLDVKGIDLGIRNQTGEKTEIQLFISYYHATVDAESDLVNDELAFITDGTSINFNVFHYFEDNIALVSGINLNGNGENIGFGLRFDL